MAAAPTIRAEWIRERLRVPELERLLGGPIGARIDDNFDSLRVRVQKAVDRIGEEAGATAEAVRRRTRAYGVVALASLAVFVAAMTAALRLPSFRWPGFAVGVATAALAKTVAGVRGRLVGDLKAVEALADRFRDPLAAARTPEDLHRLAAEIRADMAAVIGDD